MKSDVLLMEFSKSMQWFDVFTVFMFICIYSYDMVIFTSTNTFITKIHVFRCLAMLTVEWLAVLVSLWVAVLILVKLALLTVS